MEKIVITTKSKRYPLYIGSGIIANLSEILLELKLLLSKILIITDKHVADLYLDSFMRKLTLQCEVYTKIVENGEHAKSFRTYYECQTAALEHGLDRDSFIIAFGGGVVGDLAGFVAATFMRGIAFIQIPTTLLAHDSSVGGKVAINHPLGKNMIGSFHQPEAVIYDVDFLATLPVREIRSGLAEVIKHAIIGDPSFYAWILENITSLSDIDNEKLLYAIKCGINVKAQIVAKDERESGIRAFLNFGHTLGHAMEADMGYGNLSHGDAVAIGMLFAIKVSEQYFNKSLHYLDFKNWFRSLSFPISIIHEINVDHVINFMKHDKKAKSGVIKMVLLKDIGETIMVELEDDYLKSLLIHFIED